MKYFKSTCLLAGGLFLLLGNHSQAQYTVTGTNAQGGYIITGTGATSTPLGPGAPLSTVGFDQVTLEPGFDLAYHGDGVQFQTSNDTLTNFGVINVGGYGVYLDGTSGANSGNTIINSGSIIVETPINAIYFNATSGANTGNRVVNSGLLSSNGNTGASGITFLASGSNVNNTILNSGSILTGGASNLIDVHGSAGNSGNSITNSGLISTNLGTGSTMVQITVDTGNNTGNAILNSGTMEDAGGSTVFLIATTTGNNTGNSITNTGLIDTNNGSGNNPIDIYSGSGANSGNTEANSGTIQTGASGEAILIDANNGANTGNTAVNSGLISLGAESHGIELEAVTSNTGNIVSNSGLISVGGTSQAIELGGLISGNTRNTVTNSGSITLLNNSQGIYVATPEVNSYNTVSNSGLITAAGANDCALIWFSGSVNIGNSIANSGSINAGIGGQGAGFLASPSGAGNIGNSVVNSGNITVGDFGAGGYGVFVIARGGNNALNSVVNSGNIATGTATTGVYFLTYTGDNVGNTVANSGNITQPGLGEGIYFFANGGDNVSNSMANSGDIGVGTNGTGIYLYANTNNAGNTVANSGNISTGSLGVGVYILANSGNNTNNTVSNSGVISTGIYGNSIIFKAAGADNISNTVFNSGNISTGSAGLGVYFLANDGYNTSNTVTNTGNINLGFGSDGVVFQASTHNNTGNTVVNFGSISGGAESYGVYFEAAGSNINNTVTNWGAISAGSGGVGIAFTSGSGNVVNLDGHSSVNGPITASGPADTNTLNLNFTGLTPAAIAALKAQLVAQGIPLNDGMQSSGTFTVRGVTYTYDPLVVNLNVSSYQLQAVTPNQAAIGANLDSLTYNPAPGSPLFKLFNAIDQSGNVPGALNALSPQGFEVYGDLAIANSSFLVTSIDARLNNLRNGSESIDTSGIGGDTVAGLTKDDSSKESKEIQPAQPAPDRWGFFATGDGLFFRGGNIGQAANADTAGTVAGVDGKVGDHAVIGALFAYNNTSATLNGSAGHATIQSFTQGLYGSWKDDGFYANGLAVFTRNDYNSQRNILIPGVGATANGSTNSNQYTANIDGGYDWNATSRLAIGPTAGLQYVHMDLFGFNESGAGPADLSLGGEDMNSLQTRLGLHADYHLLTGKYSSGALDFHAAWQHEYLNDSRPIGASFEGTGLAPFSIQTSSPLRDAAVVGLGVNFTFHDRLTLFTEYELEFWRSSTFEQTISGGARISF